MSVMDPFGDYLRDKPDARDSWAYLEAILKDYGLGSLSNFVKDNVIQGRSETEVVQRLRETPEYKTRFRAIEDRKKKGLPPISEADVVAYEKQATALMRNRGLPPGFYDSPDDFSKFLVSDISPSELETRLDTYEQEAANFTSLPENQSALSQLQRLYGIGPGTGEFLAFVIDPDKAMPVLQRQVTAGRMGALAQRANYGQLTREEAEQVAGYGATPEAAGQAFGELYGQRELYGYLPGEELDTSAVTREQQLGAAFGSDAGSQEKIKRKADERKARFSGGGGFAEDKGSFTGLRKANT